VNPFTVHEQRVWAVIIVVGLLVVLFATVAALEAWDRFTAFRDDRCSQPVCPDCVPARRLS
jgi:hypothetical protein